MDDAFMCLGLGASGGLQASAAEGEGDGQETIQEQGREGDSEGGQEGKDLCPRNDGYNGHTASSWFVEASGCGSCVEYLI